MKGVFAHRAWLTGGWSEAVRLEIDAGRIVSLAAGTKPRPGDTVVGTAVPGLPNAHSHAFQLALAGRAECRSPAGRDDFWSWREGMYRLAGRIDAEALRAVARQAYCEMLAAGYTAVAEFHYLHAAREGAADAMRDALFDAAAESGIRLTYIPVLYERAGFDRDEVGAGQARFAIGVEALLEHAERAAERATGGITVGIGVHSLRAARPESLPLVAAFAKRRGLPLHLHIAEQQREVEECREAYGARPVEWLLERFDVDAGWCLVHATHVRGEELRRLAASGAVVCLCPSTEANLGDGRFPLREFLDAGGRLAIGSDSQVTIDPFEELRWLEYGQRLATRSRIGAASPGAHPGNELFRLAVDGGAAACGLGPAGLREGGSADLVVLDDEDARFAAHDDATRLDALVFSAGRAAVSQVMVRGEWRVVAGRHVDRDEARAGYAAAVAHLREMG